MRRILLVVLCGIFTVTIDLAFPMSWHRYQLHGNHFIGFADGWRTDTTFANAFSLGAGALFFSRCFVASFFVRFPPKVDQQLERVDRESGESGKCQRDRPLLGQS